MKARPWIHGVTAWCCLAPAAALAADPLEEIAGTRIVCAQSADSSLARAQRLRGNAAALGASVLPNPSLVVTHNQGVSGDVDRETTLGLSVPLGIGGRRSLLQDAAKARREQAFASAHATLFEAALSFREAYVAAVAERDRASVLAEHQTALEGLSQVVTGLSAGGEVSGYDLLRQQTEARLHRRLVESANARSLGSLSLLEAWIASDVVLPPVALAALAGPPGRLSFGAALEAPRVRSLQAEARASAIEARAARRRWVPDLDVFAGYRVVTAGSQTGHGFSLGLTVPLTFFDHGQGEAAQAEAEQSVAAATADRLRQHDSAEVKSASLRLERLEASLADADAAKGDARAIETQATQLYAAGETTITELLEAFRTAEQARLAKIDLDEEIARARLSLMRAAGTMFDGPLDQACGAAAGGAR